MPVFRSGDKPPEWCELEHFEIAEIAEGETHVFERLGEREKMLVYSGRCRIAFGDEAADGGPGTNVDLETEGRFEVTAGEPSRVIRLAGHWNAETGGSGLWGLVRKGEPGDIDWGEGDPVDYPKETGLDRHYHDCDEFWIILEGRAEVITEGKRYDVARGDCIAIGRGHHHDMPIVTEPIKAVWFETSLEGERRRGHLWEHTHGPAVPQLDRV